MSKSNFIYFMGKINLLKNKAIMTNEADNTHRLVINFTKCGDQNMKIIIANNHKIIRDSFKALLEKQPEMEVIVVAGEQIYISPGIAKLIFNKFVNHKDDEPDDILTVREREVLQMLADGKKNFEIARTLYISEKTVETHRRKIMKKLAIDTIAQLTKYAIRHGLTTF